MRKKSFIILFFMFVFIIGISTQASVKIINKQSFQITYELNNGKNSKKNPVKYTSGQTTKLYAPTRTGYTFKGWYSDKNFKNKIDEITETTVGNLILYALWELEALNINETGNGDMIWSWWYYPQAISYEGNQKNLYWGFATSEGYCGIAAYDYSTKETSKTLLKKTSSVDDHNGLALTMMQDGRIMCAYAGGHNANNEIHIRISDKSENIENFGTNIVLRSSGKTCYSQILQYDGNYYIFYRVNNKNWAYRASSNGIDWTDEVILISSTIQYYCKFMPTTEDGVIRICMYSNPDKSDPNIRMGFFNLDTKKLYNADNQTELGTDNISYTNFDIIISKPADLTQRMFDVAITEPRSPMVLYAEFSMEETSKNSNYKIYDAGNVIDICQGGNPLWNPKYQLGASFIGTDKIVLSRNESDCDIVELYSYKGGNAELQKLAHKEELGNINIRNARPIADINGNAFLWHRGYYNPNCYTNFYTEAKPYFIESNFPGESISKHP